MQDQPTWDEVRLNHKGKLIVVRHRGEDPREARRKRPRHSTIQPPAGSGRIREAAGDSKEHPPSYSSLFGIPTGNLEDLGRTMSTPAGEGRWSDDDDFRTARALSMSAAETSKYPLPYEGHNDFDKHASGSDFKPVWDSEVEELERAVLLSTLKARASSAYTTNYTHLATPRTSFSSTGTSVLFSGKYPPRGEVEPPFEESIDNDNIEIHELPVYGSRSSVTSGPYELPATHRTVANKTSRAVSELAIKSVGRRSKKRSTHRTSSSDRPLLASSRMRSSRSTKESDTNPPVVEGLRTYDRSRSVHGANDGFRPYQRSLYELLAHGSCAPNQA
ncbi:hypothetical protein BCR34DRAFT_660077 [Clohesyomyces aquaticus]|uniref:Uncharacterized protein n=1 Tax=Clohesyomyces aquaticus TaxID=1231657 RepID=A0A1Y2A9L7_9PLEO|nr:hypothetical protein BCR34DRAFT_660077 [Clohesyomyces aquaticus]